MKYKTRQNIIIYGSLLLALLLIVYVAKEYHDNKDSNETVLKELEDVFGSKNDNNEEKDNNENKEPDSIKDVDKLSSINKYLDDIVNRRIENDIITYDVMSTWSSYEIVNIEYINTIVDNYYGYLVDIKIPNSENLKITGRKNTELSDENYIVVSIEFDLLIKDEVIVKNLKI